MGINKGKGGKGRKKQKNKDIGDTMRPLIFKEDGQVYGIIIKTLGNNRFEVKCLDKENEEKTRLCNIRGKMRRREWISTGDVVLVSLRDFQDDKADIIMKYLPYEVRKLREYKEIHQDVKIASFTGVVDNDVDNDICFGFSSDEDEIPHSQVDNYLNKTDINSDSDLDIDNI